MYKNNLLIKSFLAVSAILPYTAVKFDSSDTTVVNAGAATDLIIGYADELGIDAAGIAKGDRVNVVLAGIAEAKAGGNITRGAKVTSGAAGVTVAAAPAQGVNNQIAGIALMSAASGDVIPVLIAPSVMQGA